MGFASTTYEDIKSKILAMRDESFSADPKQPNNPNPNTKATIIKSGSQWLRIAIKIVDVKFLRCEFMPEHRLYI